MVYRTPKRRSGFTLIELLVVIAIMGVLMGMLMGGVQKAKEAARRIETANNMRNIGLAFHNYDAAAGALPNEGGGGSPQSFYLVIRDLVGVGNVQQGDPVKEFLCPQRRSAQAAPGKRDFGYCTAGGNSALNSPAAVSLDRISNGLTTGKCAVLTVLWMDPKTYLSGAKNDTGWHALENGRATATAMWDKSPGSVDMLGSPFTAVMPVVFADNHLQNLPYTFPQWASLWDVTGDARSVNLP